MYYAAYGMNTNLNEMSYRCPDARVVGIGTLDNFDLKFRLHADIEYSPDRSIEVLVWEISEGDLLALDILEGFPSYYNRFTVPVLVHGSMITALIYQMNDKNQETPPHETYLELCSAGYLANNMSVVQLEDAYFSSLKTSHFNF